MADCARPAGVGRARVAESSLSSEPINRRTFVRRAGGTVVGASFLSLLDGAFERVRKAMDGHYPNGQGTGLDPRDAELGMNSVLRTTHRQNFLVPPRAHRSFPLVELA